MPFALWQLLCIYLATDSVVVQIGQMRDGAPYGHYIMICLQTLSNNTLIDNKQVPTNHVSSGSQQAVHPRRPKGSGLAW